MTADPQPGTIDLWVDLVCPWCRINHARLGRAREELASEGILVDVHYRPFQLSQGLPRAGVPRREYFAAAFGDIAKADAAFAHVEKVGAAEGVHFRFDRISVEPDTTDAHRLLRYSGERGLADATARALYDAFFVAGDDIGDIETLARIGTVVGLDRPALSAYLQSGEDVSEVRQEADHARAVGVRGVPTYGVDGRPAGYAPEAHELPGLLRRLLGAAGRAA